MRGNAWAGSGREARPSLERVTRRDFLKAGAGLSGLVLVGGAGCGLFEGDGGGENILNDYLEGDISSLDPALATDGYSFSVINNFAEGLYRLDENEQPVPAQAEGVEVSGDELTYTFTLRDGIRWSDGDAVTSGDFRYAWLRAMDPEIAQLYSFILSDYIRGGAEYLAGDGSAEDVAIQTPDDKTLEVTLSDPTPFFLSLTAFPTYMPLKQDFVEEQGNAFAKGADGLLCNGPYEVTGFDPSSRVVLAKNGRYWDESNVAVEKINVGVIKEPGTALNLYEAGDLDTVLLTSDNVEQFRGSPEYSEVTTFSTILLYLNNADPALSNENVRRALQTGFDRQAYVDALLGGIGEAAYGLVPPGMPGPDGRTFREAVGNTVPESSADEARGLWERGAEELGQEPQLEVLVSDEASSQDLGVFLQGQFEERLGARVEVTSLPFDTLLEREDAGDYQMAVSSWIADYNDPMTFLDLWISGASFNKVGFASDRYDQLIAEAKAEPDAARRMDLMVEAERLVVEESAALAPIYYFASASLTKPYVKNYVTHPYGPASDYKYASIQR